VEARAKRDHKSIQSRRVLQKNEGSGFYSVVKVEEMAEMAEMAVKK